MDNREWLRMVASIKRLPGWMRKARKNEKE
jgi:hypothetical protein